MSPTFLITSFSPIINYGRITTRLESDQLFLEVFVKKQVTNHHIKAVSKIQKSFSIFIADSPSLAPKDSFIFMHQVFSISIKITIFLLPFSTNCQSNYRYFHHFDHSVVHQFSTKYQTYR